MPLYGTAGVLSIRRGFPAERTKKINILKCLRQQLEFRTRRGRGSTYTLLAQRKRVGGKKTKKHLWLKHARSRVNSR